MFAQEKSTSGKIKTNLRVKASKNTAEIIGTCGRCVLHDSAVTRRIGEKESVSQGLEHRVSISMVQSLKL